ncbi:MAG TPA: GspMb/PilO family protein [Acidobacteriaceae bacterium]
MKLTLEMPTWLHLPDRDSTFFTPLPLHIAGALVLLAINVYLVVHMAFAYGTVHSNNDDALAQQTSQMTAMEIAARPLRGLDQKVAVAENGQAAFYHDRLPTAYSTVAGQLGILAKKSGVRLTRVQYTESPALAGSPETALTEVRMDATLSGDYRPLMQFLNSLERSKSFFMISGITLSGQQTGAVNLRMRLLTYTRAAGPGEKLDLAPSSGDTDTDQPTSAKPSPAIPAAPLPRRTGAKR